MIFRGSDVEFFGLQARLAVTERLSLIMSKLGWTWMEVHEPVYLVHGETTTLAPGMCFSDEPGIYIPGKFGVRIEDCWHLTESGPRFFTQPPPSIDRPFG